MTGINWNQMLFQCLDQLRGLRLRNQFEVLRVREIEVGRHGAWGWGGAHYFPTSGWRVADDPWWYRIQITPAGALRERLTDVAHEMGHIALEVFHHLGVLPRGPEISMRFLWLYDFEHEQSAERFAGMWLQDPRNYKELVTLFRSNLIPRGWWDVRCIS